MTVLPALGVVALHVAVQDPIRALQVPLWIDLAAVVVGALAGAGVAVRSQFDVVGGLLLAVLMGLGGGIIRDLLLGLRPVAVTDVNYLPTVAVAAVAGFAFASMLQRFAGLFGVLDALSLGLFTVVGVEKALLNALPSASAVFVGVCAAIGGGILVDLVAGRPVEVVRRGPWNATAALAGACVYAVCTWAGALTEVSELSAFVVVVALRLTSVWWGLRTPTPDQVTGALLKARPRRPRRDG